MQNIRGRKHLTRELTHVNHPRLAQLADECAHINDWNASSITRCHFRFNPKLKVID